jgi:phytoene desaturase
MARVGTQPSVAIIGAGPGGLACAVLLAASGCEVVVYEAAPTIGGRTAHVRASGRRGGEFAFDRGPTFFMMPYVLDEIFAAAGKRLGEMVDLRRLDPMYRLLLGRAGREPISLDATQDIEAMCARIAAINPRDGAQFGRFINDNRFKLRHSESILRNPMRSPLDLFGPGVWKDTLKVGPVLRPDLSVHELLSKYFEDPLVRLAVSFQSKYLGMSPFECPSLFTILPFIEYEYGIWHPVGGCHALMQALARIAAELGVQIHCGAPVQRVMCEQGDGVRARGVVMGGTGPLAGSVRRHDHVVVNADATWALKHLFAPEHAAGASEQYTPATLDAKRYSCSTYMLYLGLDGSVDLPHHTIYVSEQYQQNLQDICTNGTLSEDPSTYVCNPSRIDATLAPAGKSSVYVLVPTPNCDGRVDWRREAAVLRERTFAQLRKRFGLDLRGLDDPRIEAHVELTPDDWRASNINKGATFNLAHNLTQMLHWRPQNKLRGFENVYLVGGGTHPGSGLPTIFLSAQISARMLCEHEGLRFAGGTARVREIGERREMQGV